MRRTGHILSQLRLLAAVPALLLAVSCSTDGDAYEFVRQLRGGPDLVPLLKVRDFEDDYVYPAGMTKQKFIWRESTGDWQVVFPHEGYAYAGFALRSPLDLSADREERAVRFRMKPRAAAAHITLGLADGDRADGRVLVDVPLADYEVGIGRTWGTFVVPLEAFGSRGWRISAVGAGKSGSEAGMDWSDVREFRLSTASQPMPVRQLTIARLEIGRR